MPIISQFNGIIIRMYYLPSEHNPPHIHVSKNSHAGLLQISNGELLEGNLPTQVLKEVQKWLNKYRSELNEMWKTQIIHKLPPIDS